MTTYRLDLPYTRPPLTLNQRLHRMAEATLTAQIRHDVGWLARAARIPPVDHCEVVMYWAPSGNTQRDEDNLISTYKVCCDGIVDAGVVPGDTNRHMAKRMPVILEPRTPPAMWLEIITEGVGAT